MSNAFDLKEFADRFVALWNEPDPEARGALVRGLWAPDAVQVLTDPPQEMREAAQALAFPAPPLEVRGHAALNARVTRAYEMFIKAGENVFVSGAEPYEPMAGVVCLRWKMRATGTGEDVGGGFDVISLDAEGRIRSDHQFIETS
ncbi:hypothetical protein [Actinomadura decatromicini]|uniref:Nuclear transport factor 2 family protein n=1 Tax=Actinomadura decatromicini TaxID=2604572 RepID=A0A5D3FQG7_9ACTN|nr:hypothetical protein [Actinomadura decatromicini]TYK50483.1 hypothetical protein FXF68_08110 [Actinomadura decatromicini]